MAVVIETSLDENRISRLQKDLGKFMDKDVLNKALNSAAKRGADSGRTELKRQLTESHTLPASKVGKTITTRYNGSFGSGVVGASIIINDSPNAFKYFKGVKPVVPNPRKPKLQVLEIKKGNKKTSKRYFPAQMPSGHIGVFKRINSFQKDSKRQQIQEEFGPSTTGMFNYSEEIQEKVKNTAMETLNRRLDYEIERLLNRK